MSVSLDTFRSEEEYRALADAALDSELERAKVGLTPSVSSRAAARFLGVHLDTLGQWRRRTPPLGSAFQKAQKIVWGKTSGSFR